MQNVVRTITLLLIAVAAACAASYPETTHKKMHLAKKDVTTHDILSSMGMKKLNIPSSHHRKRVAEEGRRHGTGDSRMYVIKLPPNMSYYAHADPAPAAARTLPLQMQGNGKPERVYHWNLPILQKLAKSRARFDDDSAITHVESMPTWPMGHPNALDSLAYYAPSKKNSFRKYFSGNGKPKAFYVMERDHKSAEYHRLLP